VVEGPWAVRTRGGACRGPAPLRTQHTHALLNHASAACPACRSSTREGAQGLVSPAGAGRHFVLSNCSVLRVLILTRRLPHPARACVVPPTSVLPQRTLALSFSLSAAITRGHTRYRCLSLRLISYARRQKARARSAGGGDEGVGFYLSYFLNLLFSCVGRARMRGGACAPSVHARAW